MAPAGHLLHDRPRQSLAATYLHVWSRVFVECMDLELVGGYGFAWGNPKNIIWGSSPLKKDMFQFLVTPQVDCPANHALGSSLPWGDPKPTGNRCVVPLVSRKKCTLKNHDRIFVWFLLFFASQVPFILWGTSAMFTVRRF